MFIVVSYPPQVAYVDIAPGGGVIKHPYHHCESTMVRIVEKKVETTGLDFITFPLRGNEHPLHCWYSNHIKQNVAVLDVSTFEHTFKLDGSMVSLFVYLREHKVDLVVVF